jgi:RNA dependent RNA polymerase
MSHFTGKHFFNMAKEPIFSSILQNMVLGNAVNIKKKARIKIKDSAVLIGVCDERGILKEGEVWIRICRQSYEKEEPVVQTLE